MTGEELRRRHPEAARKIAARAREEERERIRRIEEVAEPGHEDLIENAKYERPEMTAEQVARVILRRDRRIRWRGSMDRERERTETRTGG